jgi:hypothetical protein
VLASKGMLLKTAFDTYAYIGAEKSIVIHYSIPSYSADTGYLTCEDDFVMPVVNQEFFHLYADKSLILPDVEGANNAIFDFRVNWLKFPNDWEIANDFGVVKKEDHRKEQGTKQLTMGEIGQVLFFGRNYRKETFSIDDIDFHTFIYGQNKCPDSALTHLLEKVAKANLYLWDDFVTNSPDWEKMKWFVEGFCEYYAMLINVKTGILPSRKLKILINQSYRAYRLSPYANKPLDYYTDNYRFSSTLEKIAYTKGAAFAFYMDGYIGDQSDSTYTLTDYMTTLIKSKERINGNLNFELMNQMAIASIGIDISDMVTKHIIKGEAFWLKSPLIETVSTNNFTTFEYGFYFIESTKNEVIILLRKGG